MPVVTESQDTRFLEFLDDFREGIRQKQLGEVDADNVQPVIPREEAMTAEFLERLCDGGDLPDMEPVNFPQQKLGNANAQANAYAYAQIDRRVDLVVAISAEQDSEDDSPMVPAGQIVAAAKRALHVYKSARRSIHEDMEPSSAAADMFQLLHQHHEEVTGIRIVVLVDGTAKLAELEQPDGVPRVKLDVWDHVRLHRVCTSGLPYEAITIDLLNHLDDALPFVESGVEVDDHECYLTIFPGDLLHDLYDEHGARLLELNVRSFLQARGKVNKGIRKTLEEDPDHFLAFNNGISATVEELEFGERKDGSRGIVGMKGLQVVNGGQTTASIHRAKKQDGSDLSRVRVQVKITVVKPEHLDTLVPNISRFSNTQNKVNETDFSANHPYHVLLQQLSERIWAPGETVRWFYERARGQWEVARSREGTTPARKRAFDAKTPKKQKIDKTLLARSENSWNQKPHIVSRGGQKNFVDFMTDVGETLADEAGYREIVARVILLKAAEKIARQIGFSAYRANAITYTVSLLSYRTHRRVDLNQIWTDQAISPALEDVLRDWMPRVHESITETAFEKGKNVTEWAKKPECWAVIQHLDVDIPVELEEALGEGLPLPNVGAFKDGKITRDLTEEEMRRQEAVMAMTADDLAGIFKKVSRYLESHGMPGGAWMAMNGCLTTLQTYAENGWSKIPSPKQTGQIFKALAFLEEREDLEPDHE